MSLFFLYFNSQRFYCYTMSANVMLNFGHYQDTALHVAAKEGKTTCVELLLSLGAKLMPNKDGKSFFDLSIEAQDSDVAMAIVRHER